MSTNQILFLLLCSCLCFLACNSDESLQGDASLTDGSVGSDSSTQPIDPNGPANYSDALSETSDFSVTHSRIIMKSYFEFEETSIEGHFTDGPEPRFDVESKRIGQCRLLEYTATFCTPACSSNTVCIDSECVGWPQRFDGGTLLWRWPGGEQKVEAQTDSSFMYYASGSISETGIASISFNDLTLSAPIVVAPNPDGDWDKLLETRSGDVVLRWNNPAVKARIRLYMTDCTGTHGGIADFEIECEGPDTGSLILPGELLDALDSGDWSRGECGVHYLERYYATTPNNNNLVRFETVASTGFYYYPR